MLKATSVPGKLTPNLNRWNNRQTISIRPIRDIPISIPTVSDEKCMVYFTRGQWLIKYINKSCPYHAKEPCLIELA